jgi:hypothetical protein
MWMDFLLVLLAILPLMPLSRIRKSSQLTAVRAELKTHFTH